MKITDRMRLDRLLREESGIPILVLTGDTENFGGYWLTVKSRKDIDQALRAERKKRG